MNEPMHPDDAGERAGLGHEPSDLKPRSIALFAAALALAIVAVLAVSRWLFEYAAFRQAKQQVAASPLAHTREATPEPRLQLQGAKELQEMRKAEDAVLNSYGWIDKGSGVVRIPVDRAIEVLAEKGLPARQEGSATTIGGSAPGGSKQQAERSGQKVKSRKSRAQEQ
jgi:hypothetical protein